MKRLLGLWLFFTPMLVFAEVPSALSDTQAAVEAKEAYAVAKRLWAEGDQACRADPAEAQRIAEESLKMMRSLSVNNLAYRARFPYSSCAAALGDVGVRMEGCSRYSTRADVRYEQQWKTDIQACAQAIRHPDLSLKNVD